MEWGHYFGARHPASPRSQPSLDHCPLALEFILDRATRPEIRGCRRRILKGLLLFT